MAETQLVLSTVVKGTETATKALNDVKSSLNGIGKAATETGNKLPSFTEKLRQNKEGFVALGVGAGLATAGIVSGIRGAIDEATKFQNAFVGLKSIADGTGQSFDKSKEFIQSFTKDGLITAGDAATALKSLFQRGFSLEESIVLLNRFKDSASFGRQSALGLGEAVRGAAEGLKNENSMLVDNAGVTQNVAKMWEIYAKAHDLKTNQLTLAQKREAEYQGVIRETTFQVGDAAKYADGYAGAVARQDAASLKLQQTIGTALMPAMTKLTEAVTKILIPIAEWAGKHPELTAGIIGVTIAVAGITAGLVALGFIIPVVTSALSALGVVVGVLLSPIGLIIGAITVLSGALFLVWKNWDTIKPKLIVFWQDFKKATLEIVESIGVYILGKFDSIKNGISDAISYLANAARKAKEYVSDILGKTGSIGASFSIQGISSALSGARANGGPVGGGQSYLVGERGPEIFTPSSSGQIIPNHKIGGSGGGIIINISGLFGQNAADEIGQHIVNRLKGASYI